MRSPSPPHTQAELLEDAESAVEARAAALLRSLEELSGESLAEYLKA